MTECTIDFPVHDTLAAIEQTAIRLEHIDSIQAKVQVDLRACSILGPSGVAMLAAFCLQRRRGDQSTVIVGPDPSFSSSAFLNDCRLFDLLQDPGAYSPAEHEPGSGVLPLQVMRAASFQDSDSIVRLVRVHHDVSEDFEDALRACVGEVVQNVQDHALSSIGGVMAAAYRNREVRIAIVDRGVGILTSLSRRYPHLAPQEVLPLVVRGRYTSRSRPNNLGLGISNLADVVRYQHGSLFMVSEACSVDCRPGQRPVFRELVVPFRGTGVFFGIPVSE